MTTTKKRQGISSVLAVAFTSLVLAPALVMSATPAYAYDIGWPSWLERGLPATIETLPKGAITGAAAEVAVGTGAAGAGAVTITAGEAGVLASAGVLSYVGTTKVLHWAFGDGHDDRSVVETIPGSSIGWKTPCDSNALGYPSPIGPRTSGCWGVENVTDSLVHVRRDVTCVDTVTGVTRLRSYSVVSLNAMHWGVTTSGTVCGYDYEHDVSHPDEVIGLFDFRDDDSNASLGRWKYDPPKPWTVNVVQYCRDPATGAPSTATSTPYTIDPSQMGDVPDLTVPSCVGSALPEAVGLTGGRTGVETGLLAAWPETRTQNAVDGIAESPAPSPAASPAPSPAPSPQPYPDDDASSGEDGCSFGLKPWLWPYRALKCALVPSAETQARLQTATSVTDKVPFSWVADATGWLTTAFGGASGHCIQWSATLPEFGPVTMLDTCTPGPIEGILMGKRTLLGVCLYVGLLAPLAWYAWRQWLPGRTGNG